MAIMAAMMSCSRSASHYNKLIDNAEQVTQANVDSAMSMLDDIDPSDIDVDSIRAKYHYLRAWAHVKQNRSMISDSLLPSVHEYYRGRDIVRDMRSGTALAWYKFWVGDIPGAISLLDSLVKLENVPDSLMVQTLRTRVMLGVSEYQGESLIPLAKRLHEVETDTVRKMEARYMLLCAYEYAGKCDSALMIIDGLIEQAKTNRLGDKHFMFSLERAQILTELGRYDESQQTVDYIFSHAGEQNGAADYLHLQSAINALNSGNLATSKRELALADSCSRQLRENDDIYYRSYSNLLHAMIDFKESGRMKLSHVNSLNNRQQERYNRMKASQWESETGALQQQSMALSLKAESAHKTIIILLVTLAALVMLAIALWIIRQHRQRDRENEERAEALQKMVDELKATPAETRTPGILRRAMLQQLGIIKMVAETPTEQNREMLRKISSFEGGETKDALVNWTNVHELIDNLYDGFYTKVHQHFGDKLTDKEEQIIVMMMAGFSTKEISVITGQTTSTIYVRKTSIRKKLGVPEKEDILVFLQNTFVH